MDDLLTRYLPAPSAECPLFVGDSDWHPIIDGADYCTELADRIDELGAGDALVIAGLAVSPDLELRGRPADDPRACPLAEQLCQAALRGVDVRILVAGKTIPGTVPPRVVGPFAQSARDVRRLRSWQPRGSDATPLAAAVGFDYSGPALGSNHQKLAVVRRGDDLTAWVGGVDLVPTSRDSAPHNAMRLRGRRWGWHDLSVRLRGPAAERVWDEFRRRWAETAALPARRRVRLTRRGPDLERLNPADLAPTPPPAPAQPPVPTPGTAVRVQRSVSRTALPAVLPSHRAAWTVTPVGGYQEIFAGLTRAIDAAQRYVYMEDQYLEESLGADSRFELYPHLRAAVVRGVKVIVLGSGVRDPEDLGIRLRRINRRMTSDIRQKVVEQVPADHRDGVAYWRLDSATVHAKLVMIDDVYADVGSANMFARSMSGVDCEISAAVATSASVVSELRVRLWAEHLRAPLTPGLREALENLDLALGMWSPDWLPAGADRSTWQRPGSPPGFAPNERVLSRVLR